MTKINIRDAKIEDASEILKIYSYYVENTAISFEYEVPTIEEFQNRMKETMERFPYLVVTYEGAIKGYAYAGPLKTRAAYGWSCETTIYIEKSVRQQGLGRLLHQELENRLKKQGILNLYACIGYVEVEDEYLTRNSARFHEHVGFCQIGRFHQCGYKFHRWYDMIWMEKIIGEHTKEETP